MKSLAKYLAVPLGLLLFVSTSSTRAGSVNDQAAHISQVRLFDIPIVWIGDKAPTESETQELWESVRNLSQAKPDERFTPLAAFVKQHPDSAWNPSLQALLGRYYRVHGRYSLALENWEAAWAATKGAKEGDAKHVGDYTLAHWTELLTSLGRVDRLNKIYEEANNRYLDHGQLQEIYNSTREAFKVMINSPGTSYRCGTMALFNVGEELKGKEFK